MRRLFTILLVFCALTIQAQNAVQILDKTAAKLRGCVTATFNTSGAAGNTSGTITIQGNKFYLASSSAKIWFDGKTQWALLSGSDEVNVTKPTAAEAASMNPTGFINLYKQGYNATARKVGTGYEVTLKAKGKKAIPEMVINTSSTYQLQSVRVRQGKGWTTIKVKSLKATGKKSDAAFRFNRKDYPKVEVIDLR